MRVQTHLFDAAFCDPFHRFTDSVVDAYIFLESAFTLDRCPTELKFRQIAICNVQTHAAEGHDATENAQWRQTFHFCDHQLVDLVLAFALCH